MQPESTRSDGEPPESSRTIRKATVGDRRLDRRTMIRGVGAVLVASSLAGCYHDDGGDGDGGDGGGGGYSVDDPAVPSG